MWRALGAWGLRVTDPGQLPGAIQRALDADGPAVLEVIVDPTAVAGVAFLAGQASRAGALAAPTKG